MMPVKPGVGPDIVIMMPFKPGVGPDNDASQAWGRS